MKHGSIDMMKVSKFDAVEYLDSEEMIEEYLTATKECGNPDVLRSALVDAEKARAALFAQKAAPESESLTD